MTSLGSVRCVWMTSLVGAATLVACSTGQAVSTGNHVVPAAGFPVSQTTSVMSETASTTTSTIPADSLSTAETSASPQAPPVIDVGQPTEAAERGTTVPGIPLPPPPAVWADPAGFQQPWGTAVAGVLTFRGNPTRSFGGTGPMPVAPQVLWRYPDDRQMCGESEEYNEVRAWCGIGWTGQPVVLERNGQTWVSFGAYDYDIHFVDGASGLALAEPIDSGDIAKGSPTADPDGYPLIYAGSRDNKLRVIAIDRPQPEVLWSLNAADAGEGIWNNDWDGSPLVLGDWLIEGGENSRMHAIKLNRSYGPDGLVTVTPTLEWSTPAWDQELLDAIGDRRVSLESSVTMVGSTVYVASSGGLVQGWDLSTLGVPGAPEPQRTFRFWTGDDTDATIVADSEGYLYVGVEVDRDTARTKEVGQFLKLDPRLPDQPVVWAVDVNRGVDSGTWSTPAIFDQTIVWPTRPGTVFGLDRATGATLWELAVAGPLISSPTIVDGVLVLGDGAGVLRAWAMGDGRTTPIELWSVQLDGNIEASPAIWRGRIYIGSRDGHMYAIGDSP